MSWLVLLGVAWALAWRPTPLFVNLGAGDEPFARGFRSGWERDGLRQTGLTQFRWTLDGARLELPLQVGSADVQARLRVARFTSTPAEVTLWAGGVLLDQWTQPPRGWRVREVALGELRGPLVLTVRSRPAAADALGIALDWVELRGIGRFRPSGWIALGWAALLLGVPTLVGLAARRLEWALWTAAALAGLAAVAVGLDRFGGLMALAAAGPLALVVLPLLGAVAFALSLAWPQDLPAWPRACVVPGALAVVTLVALAHPFFYYPDVDTHARFLTALGEDPMLLLDATDYQARTGAWTREVAGRRLAFPYSPLFHLLARPLAPAFGASAAVKALGVLAAAVTVLLAHALARGLGLGPRAALLAQLLTAALPVMASRLTLALFPALLGQAMEALLLVHLRRRLPHLDGARDGAAAFGFLFLAQLAYTGSLLNVAVLVVVLGVWQTLAGEWRRALRLLGAWMLAGGLVVALLYVRFLPVLWHDLLPHAGAVSSEATAATGAWSLVRLAQVRLTIFYDLVHPLLVALGVVALRGAPVHARRVVFSGLVAGLLLLLLRFTAPAVFRDAKEVELLAVPVAVSGAAALRWAWRQPPLGRVAALALALSALAWGAARAVALYAERFLAIGR